LLEEITAVAGVRGAMLATARGPVGAVEHAHLALAVATDVSKTVRRLVVASTTANAPLRELLINFGPMRMMLRPLGEDVLVVLLDREVETPPIRELLDLEIERILRVMRGEPEEPMAAFGLDDADDDIGELLASPLGRSSARSRPSITATASAWARTRPRLARRCTTRYASG